MSKYVLRVLAIQSQSKRMFEFTSNGEAINICLLTRTLNQKFMSLDLQFDWTNVPVFGNATPLHAAKDTKTMDQQMLLMCVVSLQYYTYQKCNIISYHPISI